MSCAGGIFCRQRACIGFCSVYLICQPLIICTMRCCSTRTARSLPKAGARRACGICAETGEMRPGSERNLVSDQWIGALTDARGFCCLPAHASRAESFRHVQSGRAFRGEHCPHSQDQAVMRGVTAYFPPRAAILAASLFGAFAMSESIRSRSRLNSVSMRPSISRVRASFTRIGSTKWPLTMTS